MRPTGKNAAVIPDVFLKVAWLGGICVLWLIADMAWQSAKPAGRRIRHFVHHQLVGPIQTRHEQYVMERAMHRVRQAVMHLDPVVPSVPTPGWAAMVQALKAWCTFAPWSLAVRVGTLIAVGWALLNVGKVVAIAREMNLPPDRKAPQSTDDPQPDPLHWLWGEGRDAVNWGRETLVPDVTSALTDPMSNPTETATTAVAVVLLVMLIRGILATVPTFRSINDPAGNTPANTSRTPHGHRQPSRRPRSHGVDPAAQWRPVAALLVTCGHLGRASKELESGRVLEAPRVSLKSAEQVVWGAWKTRHGDVRRSRRRELKDHAAKVAGVLRAMEARQDRDADTAKVFHDTAVMVLKVAQRYAEGRTLALLDPADLEGVEPVVSREWLRLVALSAIVTSVTAGALLAGLPDAALVPLTGAVSLIAWAALYGGRMVTADLVDVMRGQSRK